MKKLYKIFMLLALISSLFSFAAAQGKTKGINVPVT